MVSAFWFLSKILVSIKINQSPPQSFPNIFALSLMNLYAIDRLDTRPPRIEQWRISSRRKHIWKEYRRLRASPLAMPLRKRLPHPTTNERLSSSRKSPFGFQDISISDGQSTLPVDWTKCCLIRSSLSCRVKLMSSSLLVIRRRLQKVRQTAQGVKHYGKIKESLESKFLID